MARHEVRARLDTKVVAHKDLEVMVRRNGEKLGTLLISKGNIEWIPKRKYGYKKRFSWQQFAEVLQESGRTVRVKR